MSRPPRIAGFNYLGPYCSLVTCCTHLRCSIFNERAVALEALEQFRQAAIRYQFEVLAYCVMPDHMHLLARGIASDSDLRKFVRVAKQRAGYAFERANPGGSLWQEGFHERVLRQEEDTRVFARYVVENPVRAGIVREADDYEFVGSDVWTIQEILEAESMRRTDRRS